MDAWLEDDIKELLTEPCLSVSGMIGRRLDNRRKMGQAIDERALTESVVDSFDTRSDLHMWGSVVQLLRDRQIYLNTSVRKSTTEHFTGADIGLVLSRKIYDPNVQSRARYAVLIQCKRVDNNGRIADFYHTVSSSGKRQSSLLLDITPASFYFLFVAPSMVKTYCSIEPLAFVQGASGCSSPIWNMGCFGFDHSTMPFLTNSQKAQATSILVVPALAVEAQKSKGKSAKLDELIPNAMPFWYWFTELFIPGFVGDYRKTVLKTAANVKVTSDLLEEEFGVHFAIEITMVNG